MMNYDQMCTLSPMDYMKTCQDMTQMTQMSKNSMNAWMTSSTALTKSCTDYCTTMTSMMKECFENSMNISKTMMSATNMQDAMTAQSEAIKNQSAFMMSQAAKLSEISKKIAQDAMGPFAETMNATMSNVTKLSNAA